MESSSKIKKFSSEFDVIQQNVLLSQFKYNYEHLVSSLADAVISQIDSAEFSPITLTPLKNSSSQLNVSKSGDTVDIYSSFTSIHKFNFYGPSTFPLIAADEVLSATVLQSIRLNLERLLLLSYRQNIDFDKLASWIFNKAKTASSFSISLHTKTSAPNDYGIIRTETAFSANMLTVSISTENISKKKDKGDGTWFLPDGQQVPKNSVLYTIEYSDKIDTLHQYVAYQIIDDDNDAEPVKQEKQQQNKTNIISAIYRANAVSFKDIIMANTAEDNVFSTMVDFFEKSDAFQSSENCVANLMNIFNWNLSDDDYDDSNNIKLLKAIDAIQTIDSAHSTDSGVFSVFKFPTTKNKRFIDSIYSDRYVEIKNGILQAVSGGKTSTELLVTDILAEIFSKIVGDSSTNTMNVFLSRTIGPAGNTQISYQQIHQFFFYFAKLLENIKIFSFNVYMKRNSTYPYKQTTFLTTLYPEIPFNNDSTDSYYQAVLDSPTFQQTGVKCNALKSYTSFDYQSKSLTQSSIYANFFEMLYSSRVHYSDGRLLNPYSVKNKNLIYTTVESHRESPTFDVFDKNGSNGQLMYFVNYRTSTYKLTDQVDGIISMMGIVPGQIIAKKNVLQAFYALMTKWHENIRQLHCDIFCCHANCHTVKYYPNDVSAPKSTDEAISKDINIRYHFYGWDGSTQTIANNAAVFERGIKEQMTLPNDETITTWSSSRQQSSNDYSSQNDQLKIRIKFPEYHGSAAGINIYAEYQINDFFSINQANYSAKGTGEPFKYPVKIKAPVALLGTDVQKFPDTELCIITCEDRLDATGSITGDATTAKFIPVTYYTNTAHTSITDLDFNDIKKTMLSCIPTDIDVYYKATFSNVPPSYGIYPLEKAKFALLDGKSDVGYVFPDAVNFEYPRIYDGIDVYYNNTKVDADYDRLGPYSPNRKSTVGYFATEFCPSMNLYSCKIPNGETMHPSDIDLVTFFKGCYPAIADPDMQTMITTECNVFYTNRNGLAGPTGIITISAKDSAKIFSGSKTIQYTVNIMPVLSLTSNKVEIAFDPRDLSEDGEAINLEPRIVCKETVSAVGNVKRDIDQTLFDIERPHPTTDGGKQTLKVIISPQAATCGDLYYSDSVELTCYTYQPPDDPAFDDGMKKLADLGSTTWAWDKTDADSDGIGDSSLSKTISKSIIFDDIPLRIKVIGTAYRKYRLDGTTADNHTVAGMMSVRITLHTISSGNKEFMAGSAAYSARGPSSNPDKVIDCTRTFYYEISEANLKDITGVTVELIGSIFSPNGDKTRSMTGEVWCNYDYKSLHGHIAHLYPEGGTGANPLDVEVMDKVYPDPVTPLPTRDGYKFIGYFTDRGTQYVEADGTWKKAWDIAGDGSFYARWGTICTITLNKNGGSGGSDTTTAVKGYSVSTVTALPSYTGHTFMGYYESTGGNRKYIDANGESSRNWDKDGAAGTLYAHWTTTKTKITFNRNGGSGGTSSKTGVEYGSAMPSITKPRLNGYDFVGYFDDAVSGGKQYYDANGDGVAGITWDHDDAEYTLIAHWQLTE